MQSGRQVLLLKTLSVAVVLAVALSCLVLGQAKPQQALPAAGQTAIQEVAALERAWIDASRQYDVAWFERSLADSFISTDEDGVATAIGVVKGSYTGKDNSGKYPWTDTWVKRGGQWQCVASHASKIVPT
jgi:hypothetical protein